MNANATPTSIAEIKRRVDVRALAGELGLKVARGGRAARCPNVDAHKGGDRHPSMQLFDDGFICHAAGCGVRGDCFDLVRLVRGGDFSAARDWLAPAGSSPRRGGTARPPRPRRRGPAEQARISAEAWSARVELHAQVWRLLPHDRLPDAASSWLRDERGIDPAVAFDAGCRDWEPAVDQICAYLDSQSRSSLRSSGFVGSEGNPWWPLAALARGDRRLRGLGIPIWLPEYPFPIGWRWRLFRAVGGIKALAQSAPAYSWVAPPLGLRGWERAGRPDALSTPEKRVLIVAEGEPDWLTLTQATAARASVVGVVSTARGWPRTWDAYLDGFERVVAFTHETSTKLLLGLRDSMVERFGPDATDERFRFHLFPESRDANDLHRAGRLGPYVEAALEGDDVEV